MITVPPVAVLVAAILKQEEKDMSRAKRISVMFAVFVLLSVILAGCSGTENEEPAEDIYENTTDEMFTESDPDATLYVFQIEGRTYTADEYVYEVDAYGGNMEDGGFYKITADVDFLNGGVAGYVDYPQINEVLSCEEVSPFDLDLPSITDSVYGVTLIGDYADGDVFVNAYDKMAVWKDGEWIYFYDDELKLEDGTKVCCVNGVTEETVEAGIDSGVLLCDEYFALP